MFKQILFVIDDLELKYFEFNDLVTNFWIIKEFLNRGYFVSITTKNRLYIEDAAGSALVFNTYEKNNDIFYEKQEIKKQINDFDVVFFRPDPPVDIDYINACYVFDYVDLEKTFVINNPRSVKDFNEKFHINYFPEYVPSNIVTSSKALIKEFVKENREAVIKPLNRCFGSGVYYLSEEDKNFSSIVNSSTENGKTMVMVQKYMKSDSAGDKRVLILGNKVYDECITKLPGEDDFKFSTHSDKFFAPAKLTDNERKMALNIAQTLYKKGIYMVGLDVINEKIIEINVTSPCYFIREINSLYSTRFEEKIMVDLIELIESTLKNKESQLCSNV